MVNVGNSECVLVKRTPRDKQGRRSRVPSFHSPSPAASRPQRTAQRYGTGCAAIYSISLTVFRPIALFKPLAEELLFGKLVKGGSVKVTLKDGKLDFEIIEAQLQALPKPDEDGDGGVDREEIEA